MVKHLDHIYRDRYIITEMVDSRVYDSRQIYWKDIPDWSNVVKITAKMKKHTYAVSIPQDQGFLCFINFRIGGSEPHIYPNGKPRYIVNAKGDITGIARKQIHRWCIGWTDGHQMTYKEIDFQDPSIMKEKRSLLSRCLLHPSLTGSFNG